MTTIETAELRRQVERLIIENRNDADNRDSFDMKGIADDIVLLIVHHDQTVETAAQDKVIKWLEADLKRLDSRNWTAETLALDFYQVDEYQESKRQEIIVDRRAAMPYMPY